MTKFFGLLFTAALLAGCQTGHELPGLGSGATTRGGQLRYATPGRSLVGDFVLRSSANGDYDLSLSKSGVSLLQLQVHGDRLAATGSLARAGWTGPAARVPGQLRTWAELREVIPAFGGNGAEASRPGKWQARFARQGAVLQSAQIRFARGDSLLFNFAQ